MTAIERLKSQIRSAIRDDDWDEIDRLLDVKRPKVRAVDISTVLKTKDQMFHVINSSSVVLVIPSLGKYEIGEELVMDRRNGLLRKKRRGVPRAHVDRRFYVVAGPDDSGRLTIQIVANFRGGIVR